MKNRIIVFEEIEKTSKFTVDWYLLQKAKVYYYRIASPSKEEPWIKRYIEQHLICSIEENHNILGLAVGLYPDLAYANVDKIFASFEDDEIVKRLAGLYDGEAVFDVFKKNLLGYLQRFYYLNFVIDKLSNIFPGEEIYFIPTLKKDGYRNISLNTHEFNIIKDLILKNGAFCLEDNGVKFPRWFACISAIHQTGVFIKIRLQITGFILWAAAISFLNSFRRRKNARSSYKFGIMIISPARQFANNVQKVDFLIDENNIKKEDVLFISWKKLSGQNRDHMRQKGLDFADGLLNRITTAAYLKIVSTNLRLLAESLKPGRRSFILESAQLLFTCHAMWHSFSDTHEITNLVSYCDFGPQSLARNIVLSKKGVKTWYYTDAFNFTNLFISDGNANNVPFYSSIIGLLNYDYFVSWSDDLISYFKIHTRRIKNFINIGCLWSSHVKAIRDGAIRSDLLNILDKRGFKSGHKLVSVFDSTYADYTVTPYEHGIEFLKGIYRLAEEVPDIFIVYKEKKPRTVIKRDSKEMLHWIMKLERHPRCYLPLARMNTSEAIAFSDLVISFPFTSTTFEALCARKKALYYDASGKFHGTFYDQVPGLVCHDYEELLSRVKELLYSTTSEEYDRYLEQFIKGRMEPYLDSDALSRFRKVLASSEERERYLVRR